MFSSEKIRESLRELIVSLCVQDNLLNQAFNTLAMSVGTGFFCHTGQYSRAHCLTPLGRCERTAALVSKLVVSVTAPSIFEREKGSRPQALIDINRVSLR